MTVLKDEIKKCPFCGSKADVKLYGYRSIGVCSYCVQCVRCYAQSDTYEHRDDAVIAWNRRFSSHV